MDTCPLSVSVVRVFVMHQRYHVGASCQYLTGVEKGVGGEIGDGRWGRPPEAASCGLPVSLGMQAEGCRQGVAGWRANDGVS